MSKHWTIPLAAILVCVFCLPTWADEQVSPAVTSNPIGLSGQSMLSGSEVVNLPVKYIGNSESRKFHRPSCPYACIMAHSKRVRFFYRRQAIACGHIPCRYCLPPVWKVVRARLQSPASVLKDESTDKRSAPP